MMWRSCQTSKEPSSPIPYNSTLLEWAAGSFCCYWPGTNQRQ